MYGQLGRKKYYRGEIRLVPMLILLSAAAIGLLVLYFSRFSTVAQEAPVIIQSEPVAVDEEQLLVEVKAQMPVSEPIKIPLIVIDPGHGGEDEGCSREGVMEREINLELARGLADKLSQLGYEVKLKRESNDTQLSLEERVAIAEAAEADLFISIHQNTCEESESTAAGIETWYCEDASGSSKRLAQLVHMGAVEKTQALDRELRQSGELYVIRETSMPACLIETGFLSNKKEREAVCNPEYQDNLESGIAQGIDYYLDP